MIAIHSSHPTLSLDVDHVSNSVSLAFFLKYMALNKNTKKKRRTRNGQPD